jgi:predicted nucleic acid-binding protein
MNKKPLIYIDTSVIGGLFDEEFQKESRALFEMAENGDITLMFSDIVLDELVGAPIEVQNEIESLQNHCYRIGRSNEETIILMEQYLKANVVGKGSRHDAHHVAIATVFRADMIVSWNFKHIVHFEKIRGFNSVNIRLGYGAIEIFSPKEVV